MRRIIYTLAALLFTCATNAQTTQILGAPGTKIVNRGDFQVDSILYIPRTQVTVRTPSQSGALRYQASDSSVYHWTGTAWRKASAGTIDSLLYSTRAWRQKGIDSINAVNASGTGISGYITRWSGTKTMDTSQIFQLGDKIGIRTATPTYILDIPYVADGNYARLGNVRISAAAGNAVIDSDDKALEIKSQNQTGYIYSSSIGGVAHWGINTGSITNNVLSIAGRVSIGADSASTAAPVNGLKVQGRLRVNTMDSTATGINMLYQDVDGTIKKTAAAGGGGGVTTMAAIGSSPNANGATISSSTLTLQPASASFGGVVTTGTQTFAGAKTFSGGIESTNYLNVFGSTTTEKYIQIRRYHADSVGAHYIGDDGGVVFGDGLTINSSGPNSYLFLNVFGHGRPVIVGNSIKRTDKFVIHADNASDYDIMGAYLDGGDTAFMIKKNGELTPHKAVAFRSSVTAPNSGNYTVTDSDYFISLADLSGANRNVVLPTNAEEGRLLVVFNTSSDGTYKWSFSNEDVEDAAGAAVTTLTDQKCYNLIYHGGKFRITSVY